MGRDRVVFEQFRKRFDQRQLDFDNQIIFWQNTFSTKRENYRAYFGKDYKDLELKFSLDHVLRIKHLMVSNFLDGSENYKGSQRYAEYLLDFPNMVEQYLLFNFRNEKKS